MEGYFLARRDKSELLIGQFPIMLPGDLIWGIRYRYVVGLAGKRVLRKRVTNPDNGVATGDK